jgi:hypothetical protein
MTAATVESFLISLSLIEASRAFLIVLFAVMVNVLTAVCTVDPDLVNLARAFKVTRTQIFWKIGFPSSVAPMFAGLRIGSTLVVVGVSDAARALPPNIGHGGGCAMMNALSLALHLAAWRAFCSSRDLERQERPISDHAQAISVLLGLPMIWPPPMHTLAFALVIRPTMIAAGEFGRIAAFRHDQERAAMGALIVDVDALVPIADQNDRLAPDPGGEIVLGMFHLALVRDRDPGSPEKSIQARARISSGRYRCACTGPVARRARVALP